MSIEVTKFKRTGKGEIHLKWTQLKADSNIEMDMTNPEAPSQEFEQALSAIVPHFIKLAELDNEEKDNLKIVDISFSRTGDDEILAWQATAQFNLQKITGKRIVKMPKFLCQDGGENTTETNICDRVISETIYAFLDQCEKYIGGERLQVSADV